MRISNNRIYRRIVFTIATVFCVVFIFSQSLMSGNESGEESSKVLELLNTVAKFLGFEDLFSHAFVRKCAHFTEFMVLSVIMFNMYKSYDLTIKKTTLISVLSYTVVAITDESIQFFVPDRACQLTDVLIDSFGGALGIVICLIVFLVNSIRKKQSS